MKLTLIALLLCLFTVAAFGQTLPTAIYAAGVSINPGGSPMVAGTGLAARLIADSGTYAFTAVDALPTTIRPFVVTTQVSGGIAQRIVTIGKVPIYVPTSAGISYSGTNTGWAWTTGAMAVVRVKGPWRVLPNLRLVKSSVSNGTGYQVIGGILIGWGE
jgi:hypothetical protein